MSSAVRNIKFAVIGGDMRQFYAAVELADRGYETAVFGFDKCEEDIGLCTRCVTINDALNMADVLILPMPVTVDNECLFSPFCNQQIYLGDIFYVLDKKTIVFGGKAENVEKQYNVPIEDYFKREELVIANAYLTAESAIGVAMSVNDKSLRDTSVLVMGYGRIGKMLCSLLKGMGVNVYASARKEKDFAWIRAYGYLPVDTGKVCDIVSECKLIFNTIPNLVLGEETLGCMHRDSVIIDLASKPGGVDFSAADKFGIKTVWALSLPGKKLPVSAGRVVAVTILDILEDEGILL